MDAFSGKGVDVGWGPTTPGRMGPTAAVSMYLVSIITLFCLLVALVRRVRVFIPALQFI